MSASKHTYQRTAPYTVQPGRVELVFGDHVQLVFGDHVQLVHPAAEALRAGAPQGREALGLPCVYKVGQDAPAGAVYVGRGTPWGNPYHLGRDGGRARVCDLFAAYARLRIVAEPAWLDPLIARDLVCHCAPQRCHADHLLLMAQCLADLRAEWGEEES